MFLGRLPGGFKRGLVSAQLGESLLRFLRVLCGLQLRQPPRLCLSRRLVLRRLASGGQLRLFVGAADLRFLAVQISRVPPVTEDGGQQQQDAGESSDGTFVWKGEHAMIRDALRQDRSGARPMR